MIINWRRCKICGIMFIGRVCPNCSIKLTHFKYKKLNKEGCDNGN
jgi:rubrerythrin